MIKSKAPSESDHKEKKIEKSEHFSNIDDLKNLDVNHNFNTQPDRKSSSSDSIASVQIENCQIEDLNNQLQQYENPSEGNDLRQSDIMLDKIESPLKYQKLTRQDTFSKYQSFIDVNENRTQSDNYSYMSPSSKYSVPRLDLSKVSPNVIESKK